MYWNSFRSCYTNTIRTRTTVVPQPAELGFEGMFSQEITQQQDESRNIEPARFSESCGENNHTSSFE